MVIYNCNVAQRKRLFEFRIMFIANKKGENINGIQI